MRTSVAYSVRFTICLALSLALLAAFVLSLH
jgi:hypothetical protein